MWRQVTRIYLVLVWMRECFITVLKTSAVRITHFSLGGHTVFILNAFYFNMFIPSFRQPLVSFSHFTVVWKSICGDLILTWGIHHRGPHVCFYIQSKLTHRCVVMQTRFFKLFCDLSLCKLIFILDWKESKSTAACTKHCSGISNTTAALTGQHYVL